MHIESNIQMTLADGNRISYQEKHQVEGPNAKREILILFNDIVVDAEQADDLLCTYFDAPSMNDSHQHYMELVASGLQHIAMSA